VNYDNGIEALVQRAADHRQHTGRPFVTLSYAQSVDGCIAARPGQPLTLSGSQALTLTHKLRAAHEAILVGIGTVLADNPRLTVRLVEGKNPQPVVADSRLRFPLDANLLQNHSLPPWIATSEQADKERQKVLEAAGARVLRLPTNAKRQVNLAALLERLGELGIGSLMVEGGARIITSFLSDRLVDHLVLTVAPMLVGGLHGVRRLGQSDPVCLPRLRNLRYQRLEEDLVLWGDPAWEEG
jgi:3,4-dihydroxy 2-butanone 4-phosphate synthase/GTP cyclohydrolase II